MQDYSEAITWYTIAAEKEYALAQHNIGFMYDKGLGVKQDPLKAFNWFEKAAQQGMPDSQYCLGVMYLNGKGVKRDHIKAMEWLIKSAEQGNEQAQEVLANLNKMDKQDKAWWSYLLPTSLLLEIKDEILLSAWISLAALVWLVLSSIYHFFTKGRKHK